MSQTVIDSLSLKKAKTKTPVSRLIAKRWSARSFSHRPIDDKDLFTILEAASWAASSMNEQPWKYMVAKNGSEAFEKMVDCLKPGNQPWAKNASVLMISLADKYFAKTGSVNRHSMHDTGAANANLMLQAAELDIYGHLMGGFDMEKTLETFNITDHEEVVCFVALGYLDDPDSLEEPFKSRELAGRKRKNIDEFVNYL